LSPFPTNKHTTRLLPRLSWSWTVLLPSDTHRKLIISIRAVLFSFVNLFTDSSSYLQRIKNP
jgi:hypothetical protein